jgi:hypothetical protein
MLHIGSRSYDLVRGQSEFSLTFDSPFHPQARQHWQLDAQYVPSDDDPGRDDGHWEHLRLTIQPFIFQVRDWRDLTGFRHKGSDPDNLDPILNNTVTENLLAREFQTHEEVYDVRPDSLTVKRLNGYLFSVELTGGFLRGDREDELHMLDEIPFAEVMVRVPLNAADPVATARAIMAREIGLTETGPARLTRHDWRRHPSSLICDENNIVASRGLGSHPSPGAPLDTSHQVVLTTPWRKLGL